MMNTRIFSTFLAVVAAVCLIVLPATAATIQGPVSSPNLAMFRSSDWNNWLVDWSLTGTVDVIDHFGNPTDRPLAADFNKDGVSDRALFRSGEWIVDYGLDRTVDERFYWGMTGDIPFLGDFNNDGTIDRAVYRNGLWIVDFSRDGVADIRTTFGVPGDIPFMGDFNNDGITDRALFRGSTWVNWIVDLSMDGSIDIQQHYGQAGDLPVVGDFDGDRFTDRAVFRSGELIIDYGMDGTVNSRSRCGQAGDLPLMWTIYKVVAPEPVLPVPVQKIALDPATGTGTVGTDYTLTATVSTDSGTAVAGKEVTFTVVAGPNIHVTGKATTGADGKAQFTYAGANPGTDTIAASFVNSSGATVTSSEVVKIWVSVPVPEPSPSDEGPGPEVLGNEGSDDNEVQSVAVVPEFPSLVLPIVTIFGLLFVISAVRKRQ